jgi:hypothetical protein
VSLTYPDGCSVYRSYDLLDRLTQTGENSFLTGASRAAAVPYFTKETRGRSGNPGTRKPGDGGNPGTRKPGDGRKVYLIAY